MIVCGMSVSCDKDCVDTVADDDGDCLWGLFGVVLGVTGSACGFDCTDV